MGKQYQNVQSIPPLTEAFNIKNKRCTNRFVRRSQFNYKIILKRKKTVCLLEFDSVLSKKAFVSHLKKFQTRKKFIVLQINNSYK